MGTAKRSVAKSDAQLPALAGGFDYGQDAGAGFEGTTGKDLAIPFLNVLQQMSPLVAENNDEGKYRSGQLYNSVTKELIDGKQGVGFQPAYTEHKFVEWVPRDKGGGFVGAHDPEAEIVKMAIRANGGKAFGKLKTVSGNDLIETYYVYGNLLDEKGVEIQSFAVVACTSTKITPYKAWTTAMFMLKGKPPIFANRARVKTVQEKDNQGRPYSNVVFEPLLGTWRDSLINPAEPTGQVLLGEAKQLREMVMSGAARASYETQHEGASPEGDSPRTVNEGGEKPPF